MELSLLPPATQQAPETISPSYCVVTSETKPGSGNSDLATVQEGGEGGSREGKELKLKGLEVTRHGLLACRLL